MYMIGAAGFHPHLPGLKYKALSKALGATMWFFIFYRARYVFNKATYAPTSYLLVFVCSVKMEGN